MNNYFDNAATTRTDNQVIKEMLPFFSEEYGNPSSVYKLGRTVRKAVEEAREKIAKEINASPYEIYFTAGGSESDNLAIKGIAHANKDKGNHIITSKIEHHAVLETCKELENEGFEVTYIGVDKEGIIDLTELKSAIKDTTVLITVMFANNEVGTIQPIAEIGQIAKEHNIIFHTDAVQAVGSIKIDVKEQQIDSLSMSGHKFYGPKGIGALYVKKGIQFNKLINGGHQEKNKRAGTENVPGIVGIGKAIELAYANLEGNNKRIKSLRDYYLEEVKKSIPNIKINGDMVNRLPGNINISFRGVEGDALLFNLDLNGIYASTGSACTSGSLEPSHVLTAMGLKEEDTGSALRITIGKNNTKEEVDYLIENLNTIVKKLRNI